MRPVALINGVSRCLRVSNATLLQQGAIRWLVQFSAERTSDAFITSSIMLFTNTASVLLSLGIARYNWVFNSRKIPGAVRRRTNTRLIGYTGIDQYLSHYKFVFYLNAGAIVSRPVPVASQILVGGRSDNCEPGALTFEFFLNRAFFCILGGGSIWQKKRTQFYTVQGRPTSTLLTCEFIIKMWSWRMDLGETGIRLTDLIRLGHGPRL